jgi:hypothetical protein
MWVYGIRHVLLAGNIVYTRVQVRGLGSGVEGIWTFFEMGVFPLGSTGIDFALGSLLGAEAHVISIGSRFGGLGVRGYGSF